MPGLSAKVFRTYNASYTMSNLLKELGGSKKMSMQEKVKLYNDCNRKVAILCNHKRTVGAGHEAQMEKMTDRVSCRGVEQSDNFVLTYYCRSRASNTSSGASSK
jgi:hypothetical protein